MGAEAVIELEELAVHRADFEAASSIVIREDGSDDDIDCEAFLPAWRAEKDGARFSRGIANNQLSNTIQCTRC